MHCQPFDLNVMGNWSIRLFRVFGIELEVHLTFFFLWALFVVAGWWEAAWTGVLFASILLVLIFTCVVLHELGHSLAARRYDIPVSRILLLPFGGMAQFERIPRNPRQEILISLAGPAVNLILVCALLPFLVWPIWPPPPGLPLDATSLATALLFLNVVMGLFNLLPIFPMDGGRVLRAWLAMRLPYLRATSIAVGLAKVLTVSGIILAAFKFPSPFLVCLLAFIYFGGEVEYRMVKRREKTGGIFVRDLTRNHFLSVSAQTTMGEAARLFESFHPGELLIIDENVPRGYLTTKIIRQATKKGQLEEPVLRHGVRKFSVLQSGWPLDPFIEIISQSSQRLYPVYSFGTLVGVLDTKNIETLIATHRLQQAAEHHKRKRERRGTEAVHATSRDA